MGRCYLCFLLPVGLLFLTGCHTDLTIMVAGSGSGSVSTINTAGSPVTCDQDQRTCMASVTGNSATLQAVPNAADGSVFLNWAGDCVVAADGNCTITAPKTTAVAYFRRTTVATGAFFTCGLKQSGTVGCWGQNEDGQLGDGSRNTPADGSIKTVVNMSGDRDLSPATADISAGGYHVCLLIAEDGSVRCWGNTEHGQTGAGVPRTYGYATPQLVDFIPPRPAVAIATGGYHSCALLIDMTVACWGLDGNGQSDSSPKGTDFVRPRIVPNIKNAKAITAGAYHTCALLTDGSIRCWGYNRDIELGIPVPQPDGLGAGPVVFFPNAPDGSARRIAGGVGAGTLPGNVQLGGYHSCALFSQGQVSCWGYNQDGEVDGVPSAPWPAAHKSPTFPSPANAVAAGGYHSCAIGSDNRIYCWGNGDWAQLGDGIARHGTHGTQVVRGIETARSVAAGAFHTCAVVANDDIRCWGRNDWGQVGAPGGPNNTALTPVKPQL